MVPLYLKHVFADEPYFDKAKIVYHAYDEGFEGALDAGMAAKAEAHGIPAEALTSIAEPTFDNLNALGMQGADARMGLTGTLRGAHLGLCMGHTWDHTGDSVQTLHGAQPRPPPPGLFYLIILFVFSFLKGRAQPIHLVLVIG